LHIGNEGMSVKTEKSTEYIVDNTERLNYIVEKGPI
jgi:chemotaxis regulatin CheY-phosphate phosphatase CheZ